MADSGQSILQELRIEGCEIAELEYVIGSMFGSWGGHPKDPLVLLFPNDQEGYAVSLIFDRDHRLKNVLAGPALKDATLNELRHRIVSELLTVGNAKVANWFLFGSTPVRGAFRYQEDFQILPVPEEAPRPTKGFANHPFLLQFKYIGSENNFVDERRLVFKGRELELLLVAFVDSVIHNQRRYSQQWALPPKLEGISEEDRWTKGTSLLCDVAYIYPGITAKPSEFAPAAEHEPITMVPASKYREFGGITPGQAFELPADLGQLISAYRLLDNDLKLKFCNAAYWLQYSTVAVGDSQSASYIGLALAIEALMPLPQVGNQCPCCQRNSGKGPTRLFKEFVKHFAPGIEQIKGEARRLYEVRSKLAHGHALLISDRSEFWSPTLESHDEWQRRARLHGVVRTAIVNWLNEQVGAAF